MAETLTADRFIVDALDDSTIETAAPGGVHSDEAPLGTEPPYIVFRLVSAPDTLTHNGESELVDALYDVSVIAPGASYLVCEAAADAHLALLHGATFTETGGAVLTCTKVSTLRYSERVNGVNWRHLVTTYRIQITGE